MFAVAADCAGATCNYWLSRWLLRGVLASLFPARVAAFAAEVGGHALLYVRVCGTALLPA